MNKLTIFWIIIIDVAFIMAESLPEEHMNVMQLLEYYGYSAQSFTAVTNDGYILQLHRIPFGKNESIFRRAEMRQKSRPVAFLQHGLLGSSADWLLNLPNESLALMLADAGFDVWLGNSRGNRYSMRHKYYSPNSVKFWQFSLDAMAKYDLEAMIDVALDVSRQSKLHYIGYSQGTLIMFAKLSQDIHSFNSKIKQFFALAPVGTIGHIKGLIKFLASKIFSYKAAQLLCGRKEFLINDDLVDYFAALICGIKPINPLCKNIIFQMTGPENNQFNTSRLTVYVAHTPAGTSTMNMFHWIQMVNSKMLRHFDFESEQSNMQHYGQKTPPLYNLSSIHVPTYLYWSNNDWLATSQDIQDSLLAVLPIGTIKLSQQMSDYNHIDFLWGLRAPKQIYEPLMKTMIAFNK